MRRQAPEAWLDYARSPTRIGYRPRMPDWRDISVWLRLSEAPEVQAAAAAVDSRDAASIARLRKRYDADLVAAALELADARRKAAAKFAGAGALWCDVAGVEQASGARVASWKARRMAEALGAGGEVLDVCCGIGGDAMALARAGLRVTAVDLDERRAWMAAMNAGCPTRAVDAESLELAGAALHADPARRRSSSRQGSIDASLATSRSPGSSSRMVGRSCRPSRGRARSPVASAGRRGPRASTSAAPSRSAVRRMSVAPIASDAWRNFARACSCTRRFPRSSARRC